MKKTITILTLFLSQLCFGNMASPFWDGTKSASAFSSRDIDIISEKIHITINKDFKTASYIIEYLISTDTSGMQIPLLFYAADYKGDFKIWVDNKESKLIEIPYEYPLDTVAGLSKFSNSFNAPNKNGSPQTITIYWEKNAGYNYNIQDLKYFKTDLTKGKHNIRVEYVARAWTDTYNWINKYSFRYSLSPAKSWRSFGALEITLNASNLNSSFTTNLGKPTRGALDSLAIWNFSKLPSDFIEINYSPDISLFAKIMIAIGPIGLTIMLTLVIGWLHFLKIRKYRNEFTTKKYSWALIFESAGISFLILLCYMFSFDVIDLAIGKDAGRYHGYTFLIMILYPLLLPTYWLTMRWLDRKLEAKINNAL